MDEQQNQLAAMLADKLHHTAIKFKRNCPRLNINGTIGAANIFLVNHYTFAPSKAVALEEIEKDFEIIRNMLRVLPDAYFGKGVDPRMN